MGVQMAGWGVQGVKGGGEGRMEGGGWRAEMREKRCMCLHRKAARCELEIVVGWVQGGSWERWPEQGVRFLDYKMNR
jgi:hypothetical protein